MGIGIALALGLVALFALAPKTNGAAQPPGPMPGSNGRPRALVQVHAELEQLATANPDLYGMITLALSDANKVPPTELQKLARHIQHSYPAVSTALLKQAHLVTSGPFEYIIKDGKARPALSGEPVMFQLWFWKPKSSPPISMLANMTSDQDVVRDLAQRGQSYTYGLRGYGPEPFLAADLVPILATDGYGKLIWETPVEAFEPMVEMAKRID